MGLLRTAPIIPLALKIRAQVTNFERLPAQLTHKGEFDSGNIAVLIGITWYRHRVGGKPAVVLIDRAPCGVSSDWGRLQALP